jgi:hypothetical protein
MRFSTPHASVVTLLGLLLALPAHAEITQGLMAIKGAEMS